MIDQSSNSNNITMPPKRFPTKEPAQIEIYGRFGKIYCKMGNLSKKGAFFEIISSNFMPRQGDLVRITVNLKQLGRSHILDGEVVWCKGLGMGVMFIKQDLLFQKLSSRSAQY
ncbi:MAG: PilZ domain-containing protein [Pseudobdellovibrio sp.]